jgi:pSer/pThr/pTyr-binding forkhead associated (FHA) protein
MVLFLEILSGPLKDQKFRARSGLAIGRREGDIMLADDGKVSGLHAKIELDNKGQMVLMDQDSANGLVINNRRVKKVALMPGVTFRVGETLFTAVELEPSEAEALAPSKTWQDHVQEALEKVPAENRKIEGSGQTFTPTLQLEFIQGIQTEKIVPIGYGPRVAGQGHLDIDLQDPEAPEIAFEIAPGPGTALFRDRSSGKVRINKQVPEDDQPLNEGDLISLGGTAIRVRYM